MALTSHTWFRSLVLAVVVQLLSLTLMTSWTVAHTRLLCSWNSPGKNTGVGCHFPLQGIFPSQYLNLCLLHHNWILYQLSHQGSPWYLEQEEEHALALMVCTVEDSCSLGCGLLFQEPTWLSFTPSSEVYISSVQFSRSVMSDSL